MPPKATPTPQFGHILGTSSKVGQIFNSKQEFHNLHATYQKIWSAPEGFFIANISYMNMYHLPIHHRLLFHITDWVTS